MTTAVDNAIKAARDDSSAIKPANKVIAACTAHTIDMIVSQPRNAPTTSFAA